MINKDYDVI